VALVEAMKLMNINESGSSGKLVLRIFRRDGHPEYGQPLFGIPVSPAARKWRRIKFSTKFLVANAGTNRSASHWCMQGTGNRHRAAYSSGGPPFVFAGSLSDEAVDIGPPRRQRSYLNIPHVVVRLTHYNVLRDSSRY